MDNERLIYANSGTFRRSKFVDINRMRFNSTADTGYFYIAEGPGDRQVKRSFREIESIQHRDACELDLVAVCEAIGSCAFIGDRTIVRNIKRTPWLGRISGDGTSWAAAAAPKHGDKHESHENMADALFHALESELSTVIEGKSRIGILLSGGMDSRVVAGVLKHLQSKQDSFSVTAYTWGIEDSRDPVYARKIADMYGWRFEHFDITAETLKNNIKVAAEEGCFYAANHLHAMADVADRAKELGTECMIAASYGDSIGRAEYSGTKVMDLPPIEARLANSFLLIDPDIYNECRIESLKEIERYHAEFGDRNAWENTELDKQLHYMRNQLGTCMNVIDRQVPLYQAFTSEHVVGLMWSYHPQHRDDEVYEFLLKHVDADLLDIPWARTGKRYLKEGDTPDGLQKGYHKYGRWCREYLAEYIDDLIFGGELQKTGLFNDKQLRFLLRMNRQYCRTDNRNKIDEISLWLSSLALFLKDRDWYVERAIKHDNRRSIKAYWKAIRFAATFVLKHNRLNA